MKKKTSWAETIKEAHHPPVDRNIEAEVLIIGGGMAGLSAAYFLAQEGKDAVLVESEYLGAGATHLTTAFITGIIDTSLDRLVQIYDEPTAEAVWQSHSEAIDMIETIVKREKINCDYVRCPAYIYAADLEQQEGLKEEAALAQKLGVPAKLILENDLNFENKGYLKVENQAKFHPMKYLYGLEEAAGKKGTRFFEQTAVEKISDENPIVAETKSGFKIKADKVIIATYDPLHNPKVVFAKKGMYKSYVLEVSVPKGRFGEAIYWDCSSPYYYFRIEPSEDQDRMILGGADHKAIIPIPEEKNFEALEEYLRNFLKVDGEVSRRWTGPIMEPSDGLALIGEYERGRYLATGFSGNGMTYSAIAGKIFADLISGQTNEWAKIYDPKRPRKISRYFQKGLDYGEEFFGGAVKNILKP